VWDEVLAQGPKPSCTSGATAGNSPSLELGASTGVGPGVAATVDANRNETSVDVSAGAIIVGRDVSLGVNIPISGPGLQEGFYGLSQVCAGYRGVGGCYQLASQNGHASALRPMRRRASLAVKRARGSQMASTAPLGAALQRICANGLQRRRLHRGRRIESVSPPHVGYVRHGENLNGDGPPPAKR
jgi:hypothetical protein